LHILQTYYPVHLCRVISLCLILESETNDTVKVEGIPITLSEHVDFMPTVDYTILEGYIVHS